ncbi:YhcN/YlaJ family sporulation lipoprotein [Aneurinibacillus tyrosinisolvens]|uniref:YhcN/YlaJ family sporulation lipoprotein n=1 Tax=Aneurinibacillus tyrosinisolvens TaxID=1443435 RepID=UPI00063F8658|nr:YhcN/YlaJ family sporulation lipoprotein [Aneurinibacillus tyrosinisolvens]
MKKMICALSAIGLAVSLAACSPNPADNNARTRTNSYRPANLAPGTNPNRATDGYVDGARTNTYAPGTTPYGVAPRYGTGPSGTGQGTYDYGTPRGYGAGTNGTGRGAGYGLGSGYGYGTGITGTGRTGYGAGTGPGYGTGRDGYGAGANAYDPAARGTYRAPNGIVDGRGGILGIGVRRDDRSSLLRGAGGRSDNGTYTSGDGRANDARYSAINRYSMYKADGGGARTAGNNRGPAQVGFVQIAKNQNSAGTASAGGAGSRGGTGSQGSTGNQGRSGSQSNSAGNSGTQGNQNAAAQNVYVDRQMLASAVANAAKHVPGAKSLSVLTTDNQVFVGCDTTGSNSPAIARDILQKVHRSALNVCPRYYNVYTSNDLNKINQVCQNSASFGNKTDAQFEQALATNNKGSSTYCTTGGSNKISSSPSRTHRNTKTNQSGTGNRSTQSGTGGR